MKSWMISKDFNFRLSVNTNTVIKMLSGKPVKRFEVEGIGEVVLRYPQMSDVKDLMDCLNTIMAEEVFALTEEKELDQEIEWLADQMKEIEKGKAVALVVEVGDKVLGMGDISKMSGASSHVGKLGCGLMEKIRGKGIGTKLLRTLINEGRERLGIDLVVLKVYHTNAPARGLYRKIGFEEAGRIEDYACHDGNFKDAITMVKDLRKDRK